MKYLYDKNEFLSGKFRRNQVVYINESAMVIVPKQSFVEDYVMVAPIKQIEFFDELSLKTLLDIWSLIGMLDSAFKSKKPSYIGYTLLINRGVSAGQKVPHTHLHYFPHISREGRHPLYVQTNPAPHEKIDPGLESRRASIESLIEKSLGNVQESEVSTVVSEMLPSKHPAQTLVHYKGVSCPHLIGFEESNKLLGFVQNIVANDKAYETGLKGYNLIFPHQSYAYEPVSGESFEMSLVTRSLEEINSPLKQLRLEKNS